MPLNIIRNDITKVSADAIVNTANPLVAVGAGVDQAIYEAAGKEQLFAERAKIGPMKPGQAAATPAFALDAKYIIHTVGPVWEGGNHGEREAVASCYRQSQRIADELGCESIAFPLISSGIYRFPKDEALKIAINEISAFLFTHDMTVYMVVYDKEAFVISSKAFADIKTNIDEKDVQIRRDSAAQRRRRQFDAAASFDGRASGSSRKSMLFEDKVPYASWEEDEDFTAERIESLYEALVEDSDYEAALEKSDFEKIYLEDTVDYGASMPCMAREIDDILNGKAETFQQMLFRLIDRKGMTDPEVYKKANIDRKLFSKIRSNVDYVPSKRTALAFAVALELNMDETIDLLRRAGLALSPSNRSDLIVGYCINHGIYNIFEINTYLFEYDEPLLVG